MVEKVFVNCQEQSNLSGSILIKKKMCLKSLQGAEFPRDFKLFNILVSLVQTFRIKHLLAYIEGNLILL